MPKAALVVMAAGIGSRFGGLKQIEAVGRNGEIIMDYSVYDALLAGFDRIVFVIKEDKFDLFKEKVGNRISKIIETAYVFQKNDALPDGWSVPEGRVKPWGTGHAVLSAAGKVDTPFAVINADDFYGRNSFKCISDYLKCMGNNKAYEYCMVGYKLKNTLTEYGYVARGQCEADKRGFLASIRERTKIIKSGKDAKYSEDGENWISLPADTIVSMNMWGFTPSIFDELGRRFIKFLSDNKHNLDKAEYFLPSVINDLINEGIARVKVLKTNDKWYGVTYKDDLEGIRESVKKMAERGDYPTPLWGANHGIREFR
jgi:dTDP-glucose pyrophosphorylase